MRYPGAGLRGRALADRPSAPDEPNRRPPRGRIRRLDWRAPEVSSEITNWHLVVSPPLLKNSENTPFGCRNQLFLKVFFMFPRWHLHCSSDLTMTRKLLGISGLALLLMVPLNLAFAGVTASFRFPLSNFSGPVRSQWAKLAIDQE